MRHSFGTCILFCPSGTTVVFCSKETKSNILKIFTLKKTEQTKKPQTNKRTNKQNPKQSKQKDSNERERMQVNFRTSSSELVFTVDNSEFMVYFHI